MVITTDWLQLLHVKKKQIGSKKKGQLQEKWTHSWGSIATIYKIGLLCTSGCVRVYDIPWIPFLPVSTYLCRITKATQRHLCCNQMSEEHISPAPQQREQRRSKQSFSRDCWLVWLILESSVWTLAGSWEAGGCLKHAWALKQEWYNTNFDRAMPPYHEPTLFVPVFFGSWYLSGATGYCWGILPM